MDRRTSLAAIAAAGAWAWSVPTHAVGYPVRPVRVVQGYAAGGNADSIARLVGAEMARSLGQPIVVESQTGAGGTIAAAAVARAAPDGYTVLLGLGGHAIAPALYANLRYRAVEDFEMVSLVTTFPMLIVARADAPLRNFADALAQARAQPGALTWGSAGVGTGHHLGGELLARMAGIQWLHVPYRGDAASLTALLSGEVTVVLTPPVAAMEHIKAGKLRALAVTGARRWAGLPDVATVAEQGVPGYEVESWAGFMAPAGTHRPVIERLNGAVNKALTVPAVRSRLEDMGGHVQGTTPEQMRSFVQAEVDKWLKVARDANIPKQS